MGILCFSFCFFFFSFFCFTFFFLCCCCCCCCVFGYFVYARIGASKFRFNEFYQRDSLTKIDCHFVCWGRVGGRGAGQRGMGRRVNLVWHGNQTENMFYLVLIYEYLWMRQKFAELPSLSFPKIPFSSPASPFQPANCLTRFVLFRILHSLCDVFSLFI